MDLPPSPGSRPDPTEFGIDPDRLAVAGDSAGANLAADVSQLAHAAGTPKIALQVMFCPRTDAGADTRSLSDFGQGYLLERASMEWFADHYGAIDIADPRLSPLRAASLAGLPPAHIHTAAFDPLRDEGEAYAHALRNAGVPVVVYVPSRHDPPLLLPGRRHSLRPGCAGARGCCHRPGARLTTQKHWRRDMIPPPALVLQ